MFAFFLCVFNIRTVPFLTFFIWLDDSLYWLWSHPIWHPSEQCQEHNGFHGIRLTSRTSSAPATSLLRLARTVRVSIIAFTTLNTRETYWLSHLRWYIYDQWEIKIIRTNSPVAQWLQVPCVSSINIELWNTNERQQGSLSQTGWRGCQLESRYVCTDTRSCWFGDNLSFAYKDRQKYSLVDFVSTAYERVRWKVLQTCKEEVQGYLCSKPPNGLNPQGSRVSTIIREFDNQKCLTDEAGLPYVYIWPENMS